MKLKQLANSLRFNPGKCINCGMCSVVCPHGVFITGENTARLVNRAACIECAACMLNCEAGAIQVQAGVGCAAAMIQAALRGEKNPCGPGCLC